MLDRSDCISSKQQPLQNEASSAPSGPRSGGSGGGGEPPTESAETPPSIAGEAGHSQEHEGSVEELLSKVRSGTPFSCFCFCLLFQNDFIAR